MSNASPAVFLDRDGVVNEVVFRQGQPASPRALEEFVWTDGILEAVKRLKDASFLVFIVTNQPDIARGKLDPLVLEQIAHTIYYTLPIDGMRVCPHDNSDHCTCRKPKQGMLVSLAAQWKVDLNCSFMVGDSWKDMAAGKRAECQTILLDRTYNAGTESDYLVKDIKEAVDLILRMSRLSSADNQPETVKIMLPSD